MRFIYFFFFLIRGRVPNTFHLADIISSKLIIRFLFNRKISTIDLYNLFTEQNDCILSSLAIRYRHMFQIGNLATYTVA